MKNIIPLLFCLTLFAACVNQTVIVNPDDPKQTPTPTLNGILDVRISPLSFDANFNSGGNGLEFEPNSSEIKIHNISEKSILLTEYSIVYTSSSYLKYTDKFELGVELKPETTMQNTYVSRMPDEIIFRYWCTSFQRVELEIIGKNSNDETLKWEGVLGAEFKGENVSPTFKSGICTP